MRTVSLSWHSYVGLSISGYGVDIGWMNGWIDDDGCTGEEVASRMDIYVGMKG